MPGFIVTRGFGAGASPTQLIVQGFLPAGVEAVRRIIRGGSKKLSELFKTFLKDLKFLQC